jgi:nucleoside-diphosphate-sugar epimerase
MRKLAITGGNGFLGSHLLIALLEKTDFCVVVLKRSSSNLVRLKHLSKHPRVHFYDIDEKPLEVVLEEHSVDTFIHCATNYGRNNDDVLNIVQSNLILPLTALQACVKTGVKLFVNTDTIINKNVSHYSLSKSQFIDWLRVYSNDIKTINLTLEHFYGAFDNDTKFTTLVIRSLLKNVENLDLTEGNQRRYFIHIHDVISAFMTILAKHEMIEGNFRSFDISAETSATIKEFVLLVKKLTGNTLTKLNFGAVPYRVNEIMDFKTDISGLKNLGWRPSVTLEEGLSQTIIEESLR